MVFGEEDLQKEENIIQELKLSRWGLLGYYIIAILFWFTIIIPLFIIWYAEMIVNGTRYYITNKRVIYDYQFMSKKRVSVKFDKIQDLGVEQGLFDRLVGIGSINVDTAGSYGIELQIANIINPYKNKKIIENIIHGDSSDSEETFKCSECGEEINNNAKFCPKCGANFEDENECPKCNYINKDGAKFCEKCGTKLKK